MKVKSIGKNQMELHVDDKVIFISYETPVAACIDSRFFVADKKHSATTIKHIEKWIDGKKHEKLSLGKRGQSFFDNLIK